MTRLPVMLLILATFSMVACDGSTPSENTGSPTIHSQTQKTTPNEESSLIQASSTANVEREISLEDFGRVIELKNWLAATGSGGLSIWEKDQPGAAHLPLLRRALWANARSATLGAFTLGLGCGRGDPKVGRLLLASSARWTLWQDELPQELLSELYGAAAFSLAQCDPEGGEKILQSWLEGPKDPHYQALTRAASFGLGAMTEKAHTLSLKSLTLLLDAADRENQPILLYPFTRILEVSPAITARLIEVVGSLLTKPNSHRRIAIYALRAAGELS
ncbi:MAG: hypothetical protein MK135_09425, partial [Polyangiaceae bacterium]|nr:hypothetical protein [Polyangiaceae bacterium]